MWKRMLPSLIVPEYLETYGPGRYALCSGGVSANVLSQGRLDFEQFVAFEDAKVYALCG